MALQLDRTFRSLAVPDAYVRIARVDGDASSLRLCVETYASTAAREAGEEPLCMDVVYVAHDLEQPAISQGYAALKTHKGFESAKDV